VCSTEVETIGPCTSNLHGCGVGGGVGGGIGGYSAIRNSSRRISVASSGAGSCRTTESDERKLVTTFILGGMLNHGFGRKEGRGF